MKKTDNIHATAQGYLKVEYIRDGKVVKTEDYKNAINTTVVRQLIALGLAGDPRIALRIIQAYNSGSLLATTDPSSFYTIVSASSNEFTLVARFLETDFNDTVDELRLLNNPTDLDMFSSVTGLSIVKDSQLQLRISWKIIVNAA